jgi:hypothetical protein
MVREIGKQLPSLGRSDQDKIDAPTLFHKDTKRIDNQSAFR